MAQVTTIEPQEKGARAVAFIAGAVALAGLVCLAPLPNTGAIAATSGGVLLGVGEQPGSVAIVGNSVLEHVSKCDADRRTIPDMIGEASGRPVMNLGYPGQSFQESLNFAALALNRPAVTEVVAFVALFQLSEDGWLDVRDQAFLRLAAGPLHANDVIQHVRTAPGIVAHATSSDDGFTYKGVAYPNYAGVKARYFSAEKAAMGCPETLGQNRAFIEAFYWNAYARAPLRAEAFADLETLNARAKASGKSFRVVLMPIDTPDVETLEPAVAAAIRTRAGDAVERLKATGINTLDLSRSLRADDFVDRWCACGHLSAAGKLAVTQATFGRGR